MYVIELLFLGVHVVFCKVSEASVIYIVSDGRKISTVWDACYVLLVSEKHGLEL